MRADRTEGAGCRQGLDLLGAEAKHFGKHGVALFAEVRDSRPALDREPGRICRLGEGSPDPVLDLDEDAPRPEVVEFEHLGHAEDRRHRDVRVSESGHDHVAR